MDSEKASAWPFVNLTRLRMILGALMFQQYWMPNNERTFS